MNSTAGETVQASARTRKRPTQRTVGRPTRSRATTSSGPMIRKAYWATLGKPGGPAVVEVVDDAVDHRERPHRGDGTEEAPLGLLEAGGGSIAPHHPEPHQGHPGAVEGQLLTGGQVRAGQHVEGRDRVDGDRDPGEAGPPLPASPVDRTGDRHRGHRHRARLPHAVTERLSRAHDGESAAARPAPQRSAHACSGSRRSPRPRLPRAPCRSPASATRPGVRCAPWLAPSTSTTSPSTRSTSPIPSSGSRPGRGGRAPSPTLRRESPIHFFEEAEFPAFPKGPGYYAVTRYDDVWHASRNPQLFCSSRGGVNIGDMPERDRRVLRVDDRHGRSHATRGCGAIVQKAFTPKIVSQVEGYVRDKATRHRRRAARALPGRRVRLRGGGRGTTAAAGHLRDDGHPRGRREAGLRLDQRDPRRRRPRVRRRPSTQLLDHEPRDQPVRHGARHRPAGQPQGRPHVGAHARRGRRRAPDDPGVRLVLHPAGGGRQRDHPQRHQPRA